MPDDPDGDWRDDLTAILMLIWLIGMIALSIILTILRLLAEWRTGWNG